MFTIENFVKGLQIAVNISAKLDEAKLTLTRIYHDFDGTEDETILLGEIPVVDIISIISELNNGCSCNDTFLSSANSFEVAVQSHDRNRVSMLRPDQNLYSLSEHNYTFELSKASALYICALLCYFSVHPSDNIDLGVRLYRQEIFTTTESFFELFRVFSVKIVSVKQHSISEFKRMVQSYLFNISYNYNVALSITDFSSSRRDFRRRTRRSGQLFPYKHYTQELTKYYHQALSVDIPFTQYLAFYHVAEYFFQSISEQDAFRDIEYFITRPSFSPNKSEDIKRFYNMIKKKMRDQREDGVWNEKNGLLLCLKKYVYDLESLKLSIESIDPSSVTYYETSLVEFADDSKKINFNGNSNDIYIDIRDRVYSVRNAIVHSKEGDKLRYEPFKHDKQLAKEIPLIRCIAEEIIINSAKIIDYNFGD